MTMPRTEATTERYCGGEKGNGEREVGSLYTIYAKE